MCGTQKGSDVMSETKKKQGFQQKGLEPLNIDVKVRITETTNKKLKQYAEKNKITRADAIRLGIEKLVEE